MPAREVAILAGWIPEAGMTVANNRSSIHTVFDGNGASSSVKIGSDLAMRTKNAFRKIPWGLGTSNGGFQEPGYHPEGNSAWPYRGGFSCKFRDFRSDCVKRKSRQGVNRPPGVGYLYTSVSPDIHFKSSYYRRVIF
jgi:hypothetical protein